MKGVQCCVTCPIFLSTSVLNMVGQLMRLDCSKEYIWQRIARASQGCVSNVRCRPSDHKLTRNRQHNDSSLPRANAVKCRQLYLAGMGGILQPTCRTLSRARVCPPQHASPSLTTPHSHSLAAVHSVTKRSCGTLNSHYIIVQKSEEQESRLCYEYSMKCGNIKHHYTCSILRLKGKVMACG